MLRDTVFPQGNKILSLFDSLSELEYTKGSTPYFIIRGQLYDQSNIPPTWLFRFKKEDKILSEKIVAAIGAYEGTVKWNIRRKEREKLGGINWLIAPQYYFDNETNAKKQQVTVISYCEKYYPDKGKQAFADVEKFVKYLYKYFDTPYEPVKPRFL